MPIQFNTWRERFFNSIEPRSDTTIFASFAFERDKTKKKKKKKTERDIEKGVEKSNELPASSLYLASVGNPFSISRPPIKSLKKHGRFSINCKYLSYETMSELKQTRWRPGRSLHKGRAMRQNGGTLLYWGNYVCWSVGEAELDGCWKNLRMSFVRVGDFLICW